MEEELLKRNTDCVYFLASPFTCKKGVECEYRHSDMARLNPRDCWYWLSGNCLNPTCAFRHPPLEVHSEASNEAALPLPSQSSVPATKTTVPCYFYYNGFCNKGDKCPFLHEPGDAFGWKPKVANAAADSPVIPLDRKTTERANTGPKLTEKHSTLSEMAAATGNTLQGGHKQQPQKLATVIIPQQNTSEQTYISQCEEITADESVSLQPADGSGKSECELSLDSDRNSEELIDGNIVRDEWLESSPGFDVLVDGRTEDMVYEDDPEYLHALDRDGDCEHLFMPHGFDRQTEYDERGFFDNGLYEPSEYLQDELRTDSLKYSSRRARDRKARRDVARKRDFLCVESPDGGRRDVDLRDYLRKRRMVDGCMETRDLRHDLLHVRDVRQERHQGRASIQRLHGRIASKVERNGVSLSRRRNSVVDLEQRGRPRNSRHNGNRQYNGRRRSRQSSTERSSYSKRERYDLELSTFSGPKSLAEIKEDKLGHFNNNVSLDFDGPKPYSEILKDKKKTASSDGFMSSGN